MRSRIRSARHIAALFILFHALASLLLGVGLYLIGDHALRDQLDQRIMAETTYLRDVHERGGVPALRNALLRRDDRGVNNLGYLLTDAIGTRLGGELETSPPRQGWEEIEFRDLDQDVNIARALTTILPDGSHLTVAIELAPAEQLRDTTVRFFLLGMAVMLIGGVAGGLIFSRAIRSRLDVMNDTALAIIGGDMQQRVPESGHDDEFQRLAVTLNRMLDSNEALIGNLRQVSSDIAHDLRTPLAHLRQRLERAVAAASPDSPLHHEIAGAIDQANATLSLFAALLRISEVESGTLRQYFERFDLSAAVRSVCESYMAVAEDGGRTLACDIEDGVFITGDRELIAQAIVNLLENALRHTPTGAHVAVGLARIDPDQVRIDVEDDGPGVPEDALPNLTRRFTRSDRARATPGFGLGLNLVQAIVKVHDGELRLRNLDPGLGAVILLPLSSGLEP